MVEMRADTCVGVIRISNFGSDVKPILTHEHGWMRSTRPAGRTKSRDETVCVCFEISKMSSLCRTAKKAKKKKMVFKDFVMIFCCWSVNWSKC